MEIRSCSVIHGLHRGGFNTTSAAEHSPQSQEYYEAFRATPNLDKEAHVPGAEKTAERHPKTHRQVEQSPQCK